MPVEKQHFVTKNFAYSEDTQVQVRSWRNKYSLVFIFNVVNDEQSIIFIQYRLFVYKK